MCLFVNSAGIFIGPYGSFEVPIKKGAFPNLFPTIPIYLFAKPVSFTVFFKFMFLNLNFRFGRVEHCNISNYARSYFCSISLTCLQILKKCKQVNNSVHAESFCQSFLLSLCKYGTLEFLGS